MPNDLTPRETMIEAMARAMCGQDPDVVVWWSPNGGGEPPEPYGPRWSTLVPEATAALDAYHATLPALGLRVVTVEATEGMLREVRRLDWTAQSDLDWPEGYAAMLAAATNPLEARDE